MVKNTPITDANFTPAWNSLVIRYGNQRILSYMRMRSLLELAPAADSSPSEIKRVMDFVQQTIRSFQSMHKPLNEWNEWFVFFLSSKLDSKTRLDWETSLKASSEIPELQTLVDFLENRLQALQTFTNSEGFLAEVRQVDQRGSQPKPKTRIAAATYTKGNSMSQKCALCAQAHQLCKCGRFLSMDLAGKQDLVRSKKLCANCLGSGHFRAKCPSSGRCRTWRCTSYTTSS